MQQGAGDRRIARREALRQQRGDAAGQQVAHAADRHPRIAGADHCRRGIRRGDDAARALQHDLRTVAFAQRLRGDETIALHVAGTPTPPLALNEGDLDPAAVEKEKKFLTDQALESGKPLAVVEKMIEGRIRKWQEEVVLLKQPFVMNPDQTIEQLIAETAKETGAPVAVKAFVRFALGEGVEKKQDDFAAEVASMTGQG